MNRRSERAVVRLPTRTQQLGWVILLIGFAAFVLITIR